MLAKNVLIGQFFINNQNRFLVPEQDFSVFSLAVDSQFHFSVNQHFDNEWTKKISQRKKLDLFFARRVSVFNSNHHLTLENVDRAVEHQNHPVSAKEEKIGK